MVLGFDGIGELGDGTTTRPVGPGGGKINVGGGVAEVSTAEFYTCAEEDGRPRSGAGGYEADGVASATEQDQRPVSARARRSRPTSRRSRRATSHLRAEDRRQSGAGAAQPRHEHRRRLGVRRAVPELTLSRYGPSNQTPSVFSAQVSTGYFHTCALKTDGSVYCWGRNDSGQLGDGTTNTQTRLRCSWRLGGPVAEVSAGDDHTCARKSDGTVWCWGGNLLGQLGDGTNNTRATPAEVTALGNTAVEVSANNQFACARKADGTLWCWGGNTDGELGNGTTMNATSPWRRSLRLRKLRRRGLGGRQRRLRDQERRQSVVLGIELPGQRGGRHHDAAPLAGPGDHARELCRRGLVRRSHVRAKDRRHRLVLGHQQQGPAGRRHDDEPVDPRQASRLHGACRGTTSRAGPAPGARPRYLRRRRLSRPHGQGRAAPGSEAQRG